MILGTAPYMSPEQINGHAVDTRTDIWGFGCLLYEMLTGKRAFAGQGLAAVLPPSCVTSRLVRPAALRARAGAPPPAALPAEGPA